MKTTISTKGQLILPAEIRQRDNIEPGQEFEVERIDRGEYRLLRREPPPNEGLVDWLLACPEKGYFVPIESEFRFGIHLLPAGKRRRRLETWFDEGVARIVCVPWDALTGLRWAKLLAELRKSGESMPIKDSLIAATALVHDFIVVTRNTHDFRKAHVKVLDPFA